MQNNKTSNQQLNIKVAVPEVPLELSQVPHQCKVHAVYSVLTLPVPIICKLPKVPQALPSEGADKGLWEPRFPGFAAQHSTARPSGGSSRVPCMVPHRNTNPSICQLPALAYKLDAPSNSSRKRVQNQNTFKTSNCYLQTTALQIQTTS